MDAGGFSAVLFDWRGTLFHDESDRDWILASAAAIGREMAESDAGLPAPGMPVISQTSRTPVSMRISVGRHLEGTLQGQSSVAYGTEAGAESG